MSIYLYVYIYIYIVARRLGEERSVVSTGTLSLTVGETLCVYIYIYMYRERETFRERDICMCVINIYIYIYMYRSRSAKRTTSPRPFRAVRTRAVIEKPCCYHLTDCPTFQCRPYLYVLYFTLRAECHTLLHYATLRHACRKKGRRRRDRPHGGKLRGGARESLASRWGQNRCWCFCSGLPQIP